MALKGKTVLVMSASGGVGETFAHAFAAGGCNIVFNAFPVDKWGLATGVFLCGDAAARICGESLPIDGPG